MPEIAKWQQVYSQQKWKNMAGVFCRIVNGHQITVKFGEKTTSISQRHQRYPTKYRQKNKHRISILMTHHHPDLGSDASSVWNFCTKARVD